MLARNGVSHKPLGSTQVEHWGPYNALADLPFPLYITTSYDDELVRVLQMKGRMPHRDFPQWNDLIDSTSRAGDDEGDYQPSVAEPLVFHLFGILEEPESLVLTEDDYLQFLTRLVDRRILPIRIRRAIASTSQLLIGHQVRSWPFRTLWSVLQTSVGLSRRHSYIHMLTLDPNETISAWRGRPEEVIRHLEDYFGEKRIHLYWGSAGGFAQELHERWEASRPD